MLDLTRLEDTEPFDLDDIIMFIDLTDKSYQWTKCLGNLFADMMENFGFAIKGKSVNLLLQDDYLADVHMSFIDSNPNSNYLNYDKVINYLNKAIQRWRYLYKDMVLHFTRWSTRGDTHWFHFVFTNNPSAFRKP